MPRRRLAAACAALGVILTLVPASGHAEAPLATGTPWTPAPQSQPRYGTKPPSEDPAVQRHHVEGHDGTDLYVETWLPAEEDGHVPPARVPTVLVMTPYVLQGDEEYPANEAAEIPGYIEYMTSRGYAVAQHHVRGTGESGGCLEQTAENQIEDGSRVVEYLGRDAPWTDGNVGMYGISYDAETQISVAGLGDPEKTKYLKAIVPAASVGGQYEYSFFDGVPYAGQALLSNGGYLATVSAMPGRETAPQRYPEKALCQPEVMASSADLSGDMTPFWQAREYRPGAPDVKAATLYVHGLRDFNVQPITIAAWFDRLPESTPHKGLFGVWNHAFPNRHPSVEPEWVRSDWLPMQLAWLDRYLKGLATGVESWPDVQVQSSDGQWRAEPEYPTTGGPVGQLALSMDGALGAGAVEGTTTYTEGTDEESGRAVFTTEPVTAPLHLTGQPVLDLWLETDRPDGHVAARIEVLDDTGTVLEHDGNGESHATYGFRSLRHLEQMPDNYFTQAAGVAPPTNEPIRVPVRFHPTDLVVPAGGQLRLTVAGTISYSRTSAPSGLASTITLLHDCEHLSALRFLMPTPGATLLDVREDGENDGRPLTAGPGSYGVRDGGIATRPVCERAPERLSTFGPARTGSSRPATPTKPAAPRPTAPKPAPARPAQPLPATGAETAPLVLAAMVAVAALAARRRA